MPPPVIASSGPSSTYPQRAYRNPTEALVKFLDCKHGEKWAIWEFRAEGTGYPDSEVYGRINHYPWPDHHPPPFALVPDIMATMRNWLKGPDAEKGRVVVVHCKAGKGRSGTIATSYLISEEGWSVEDAMLRFTARRMRNGFGAGVSIPSQVRWVGYADWWAKHGKVYVERQIEILEVHVWGLRDGVKVAIEGYVDEGKVIQTFHVFSRHEKTLMDATSPTALSPATEMAISSENSLLVQESKPRAVDSTSTPEWPRTDEVQSNQEPGAAAVLFRPAQQLILPTSDIKIDFERRNKAKYGFTMVTSVAHVWFNAFFESQYALQKSMSDPTDTLSSIQPQHLNPTKPPSTGVFSIQWDAMDGIKGSARKGTRALERLSLVWRAVSSHAETSVATAEGPIKIVTQPPGGSAISTTGPAKHDHPSYLSPEEPLKFKDLGLRTRSLHSEIVSQASSPASSDRAVDADDDWEESVKVHGPNGEDAVQHPI